MIAETRMRSDGIIPCEPWRARALARTRDLEGSRAAYQAFFTAWSTADSDLPHLTAGRQEYAAIKYGADPAGSSNASATRYRAESTAVAQRRAG